MKMGLGGDPGACIRSGNGGRRESRDMNDEGWNDKRISKRSGGEAVKTLQV